MVWGSDSVMVGSFVFGICQAIGVCQWTFCGNKNCLEKEREEEERMDRVLGEQTLKMGKTKGEMR